ncbi:unnamed protein product [Litomosoides sigmodontis]|uniref:KID domain-containing protein n=1 Tax=Litomosoides sigmodontis TaxID=42156 RepID=A0A3P6U087_LITSI|nr:unnamed protein product [Litomosoides sigmodontis]
MSREPSIIHNPSTSEPEALKVLAKVILQNQSNDEIISDDEARRRREQLNRRPSYRLITSSPFFLSICLLFIVNSEYNFFQLYGITF